MSFMLLSLLIFMTATLHIRAEYKGPDVLIYLFKPLTTSLIILMAFLIEPIEPYYKWVIILGFFFSLLGDIFLMFPEKYFIAGLINFLIAHLFYIAGFIHQSPTIWFWPSLIPFIIYGIIIVTILFKGLGPLKIPVMAYIMIILTMGWQAVNHWIGKPEFLPLLAALGAIIFMFSDTLIALDKFKRPFQRSRLYIMTTYYLAQWLIALSIGG